MTMRRCVATALMVFSVQPALAQWPASWSVDPAQYEHFMTVTASLTLAEGGPADSNFVIAAFAGSQCRGAAQPVYQLDRWVAFLMVYGSGAAESITFRAVIKSGQRELRVAETIQFQSSSALGLPTSPFVLHATTPTGVEDAFVPRQPFLAQNYPNPFNPTTTIRFGIQEPSIVRLEVWSIVGERLAVLENGLMSARVIEKAWTGTDMPTGNYILRLVVTPVNDPSRRTAFLRKMTLIK